MRMKKLLAFVLAMEVLFAVPVRGEETETREMAGPELHQESGLTQETELADPAAIPDESRQDPEMSQMDEDETPPQSDDRYTAAEETERNAETDAAGEEGEPSLDFAETSVTEAETEQWQAPEESVEDEAETRPDAVILIFESAEHPWGDSWPEAEEDDHSLVSALPDEPEDTEAEEDSNSTVPALPDEPEDTETEALEIPDETGDVYLGTEDPDGTDGTEESPLSPSEPDEDIPDLPDGQGDPEDAPLTALSGAEADASDGAPSEMAVSLSNVELSPVTTNDQYSQLTFSFSADGREYTCLVTGLEETDQNDADAWQRLAAAIAERFLAGEVFTLSNETALADYGISVDLIDAEKTDRFTGLDSNICWAASAADMLEFAGWNVSGDEDAAFQEYRDEFSNLGGYQSAGISWYLDGVNPLQYTYSGSGNVAYHQDLSSGASQQQNEDSGGYWKDYAAAEVAPEARSEPEMTDLLDVALDGLEDGGAVGLGVYFYQNQNTATAGHALTAFGYIREKLDQAVAALRALFVADSDDRATGETDDPEKRPNEYVMYSVSPYETSSQSTLKLDNYSQTSLTAAIGNVSTLAAKDSASPEREGTADAVSAPNLVPTDLTLQDDDGIAMTQAEPGTAVTVEAEFANRGYQSLPTGAVIRYVVNVYRDGVLVDQVEQTSGVESAKGMRPNGSLVSSAQVTLTESGTYTFETQILEVTSAEGKTITEAYTRDNRYLGAARTLTVQAEPEKTVPEADDAPRDPVQASAGAGEETEQMGERIYTLTVTLATDTAYLLDFDASVASPDSFTRLRNRKTGDTVDPELYKVTRLEEGGFCIAFEESFIRSLRPGRNDFALSWHNGRVLLRIIIL